VVGVFNDAREFSLFLSRHILEGVVEVLISDYKWADKPTDLYVRRLVEIARRSGGGVVEPTTSVADCADWEDNRILLVISDDHHLIEMSPWRGTPILSPRDFIARVDAMRRARARTT
jgi:predicted nucleic acid-binding protein